MDGHNRKELSKALQEVRVKKAEYYASLCHAVQTGIAWSIAFDNPTVPDVNADPNLCYHKHLRTGIDTQKSDLGALVTLLIEKKVFTEDEYQDAIIAGMEREVALHEESISTKFGKKITLK